MNTVLSIITELNCCFGITVSNNIHVRLCNLGLGAWALQGCPVRPGTFLLAAKHVASWSCRRLRAHLVCRFPKSNQFWWFVLKQHRPKNCRSSPSCPVCRGFVQTWFLVRAQLLKQSPTPTSAVSTAAWNLPGSHSFSLGMTRVLWPPSWQVPCFPVKRLRSLNLTLCRGSSLRLREQMETRWCLKTWAETGEQRAANSCCFAVLDNFVFFSIISYHIYFFISYNYSLLKLIGNFPEVAFAGLSSTAERWGLWPRMEKIE